MVFGHRTNVAQKETDIMGFFLNKNGEYDVLENVYANPLSYNM